MDFHHRRPPALGQSHPTTTAHKPRRGPAFSTVDQSPAPARHLPLDQPCPAVSRQRNPHSPHTAELDSIEELDQGRTSRSSSQRRPRPPAPLPKTAPIHPSDARSMPDTPSTSSTTPELPPPSHDPITADLTAHLDHTSEEFKTIIQEHYRRTPSLRKLADIHGVSRSTVHRIVQAQ